MTGAGIVERRATHGVTTRRVRASGFTVIELLVTVVIAAILLTVAVGGFGPMFARKRLEGVAADLVTDLQFARAEAAARNQRVHITFGSNCYLIHTPGTSTATCDDPGTGGTILKRFALAAGANESLTVSPNTLHHFSMDPIRGTSTGQDASSPPGAVADGTILVASALGSWQLRVRSNASGRTEICSPSSSTPGYREC